MLTEHDIISKYKKKFNEEEELFSFSNFIIDENNKAEKAKSKKKYPDSISDLLNLFYTTFSFNDDKSEVVKKKYFENLRGGASRKIIDIEDDLNKQVFFITYVFNKLKIMYNFANGENIRHYCSRVFKSNAQTTTLLKKNKSTNINDINGAFSLNVENNNNSANQMILNNIIASFSHSLFFTKLKYKDNIGSIYDFYVNNKELYTDLLTELQNFLLSTTLSNTGITAKDSLSILDNMNNFCEQAKNYMNDNFEEVHHVDYHSKKIFFRQDGDDNYHRLIILPSVIVSNKLNNLFFKRNADDIYLNFKSHQYLVAHNHAQNIGSNAKNYRNQLECNIPNSGDSSGYTTSKKIHYIIKNKINPLEYFIDKKVINVKESFIFKNALLNLRVYDNEKNRLLSKKSIENILYYTLEGFIDFLEELSYLLNNEKINESDLDNFDDELSKKIMLLNLSFDERKKVAEKIKDIIVKNVVIKDNENTFMWDDYARLNVSEYVENMLKEML